MKQLHPSNCLGIRSYADAQGCHDLQRAAHVYTMVGKPSAAFHLPTWEINEKNGHNTVHIHLDQQ